MNSFEQSGDVLSVTYPPILTALFSAHTLDPTTIYTPTHTNTYMTQGRWDLPRVSPTSKLIGRIHALLKPFTEKIISMYMKIHYL